MSANIDEQVASLLADYRPDEPKATAAALRALWLQSEPKSMAGIKAEQRQKQETIGIPVSDLRAIGKAAARPAGKRVSDFIPLARLLWDDYGREGRIIAAIMLGRMELADPETILPLLKTLCRTCYTWEDADQLAMNAVEPIVRRRPDPWLAAMDSWLEDQNKWVRRTGVTVVGRLPMKHPGHTDRCLDMTDRLLLDQETEVKKAVSFAIRLCARGDAAAVRDFLAARVPPADAAATWVLCDAIRSMAKKLLPTFVPLLPAYRRWAADPDLDGRDRRSVESAVTTLEKAA